MKYNKTKIKLIYNGIVIIWTKIKTIPARFKANLKFDSGLKSPFYKYLNIYYAIFGKVYHFLYFRKVYLLYFIIVFGKV